MATALFSLPAHPIPAAPTHAEEPAHDDPPDHHDAAHTTREESVGGGVDLGTLTGRRITLKPRRTLSLSPTPARTGDNNSMGRNLRAARWLDFTDKDDDDGLYQPCSDSDSEATKKKEESNQENNNNNTTSNNNNSNSSTSNNKIRTHKRTGSGGGGVSGGGGGGSGSGGLLTAAAAAAGAAVGASLSSSVPRRTSVSVKRPLDIVLPCQEIQYLDICYQKVGTVMVQYSPIPRKKIAYQHVPYISIPYCEVPYWSSSERPIKRKPLQRSHSIAVADLREPEDCEWSSYKLR
ncbi:DEP domain-containing protein DDB_G0279099-like isoform X2 [Portunus trituberculatus]|uniref:DEP domain-containing protein DDB_G0279099-like isoform X2 n=1 Tax=Portunus trituberculatus TaxID=210409 RepID=UPI001E1CC7CE|nr:DEP domain-containing protein DDB_G0279099-like isoform X2 [Portunus trituberculatus]